MRGMQWEFLAYRYWMKGCEIQVECQYEETRRRGMNVMETNDRI